MVEQARGQVAWRVTPLGTPHGAPLKVTPLLVTITADFRLLVSDLSHFVSRALVSLQKVAVGKSKYHDGRKRMKGSVPCHFILSKCSERKNESPHKTSHQAANLAWALRPAQRVIVLLSPLDFAYRRSLD